MVGVMGYYDRLEVNRPDRSYEWLIDQVKKRLDRIHKDPTGAERFTLDHSDRPHHPRSQSRSPSLPSPPPGWA